MTISLIIPTYGRPQTLSNCLGSLKSCSSLPDEVLILDQSEAEHYAANKQTISSMQKDLPKTNFRHIRLTIKSSASARNIGIKESGGDILVFSDDDIEYGEDNFKYLREAFVNSSVSLIGAKNLLSEKGKFSIFSYLFDLKKVNPLSKGYYTKSMLGRCPENMKEMTPTTWAMGYCFAVRKADVIASSISFDQNMTRYCYAEDLDFTMRLCRYAKANKKVTFYSNKFYVKHHCSKEYRIPTVEHQLSFLGNRYYLIKKNGLWFNVPFFYLTNLGFLFIYRLNSQTEDYAVFKKAKKVFSKNKKTIGAGNLDYVKLLKEQQADH